MFSIPTVCARAVFECARKAKKISNIKKTFQTEGNVQISNTVSPLNKISI